MHEKKISEFCKNLEPVGRILEDPDYNVWGCSPIYGPDGRVHVFYSRWKNEYDHWGWVASCEVAHAVANSIEGPYETVGVALTGSGSDNWDSWSIHNPTIHKVDNKYVLLYMGSNGSDLGIDMKDIMKMTKDEYWPYFHKLVKSKRVGMAIADSLDGPFERVGDGPMIETGDSPAWDDFCTSNPAFVVTPEGEYRIYYKAWDITTAKAMNGNRKYGYAFSNNLEGPYTKCDKNPVIDFTKYDPNMQFEDAYIWYDKEKYHIVSRDMGYYNHEYGLYLVSDDGINWSDPYVAYYEAPKYFDEELPGIAREGRFERPQILHKDGDAQYLFCAYRGGKYKTSSGVILKINNY